MINHYEILGLNIGAGISEIKSAFRQLAKLYHPDVNPNGKEQFTKILKAYEILSDANLKYSYDYKLQAFQENRQQAETKTQKSKNWRFDEREMKRRQYYNEHIKKYEKKNSSTVPEPEVKSSYNEFKYILFATPLAVILFLGIMTIASDNRKTPQTQVQVAAIRQTPPEKLSDLKMGDNPYTWYFGEPIFDSKQNITLTVKNLTGVDVIMCLFSQGKFLRSLFLENNYSAEVYQLPKEPIDIRYITGLYFDQSMPVTPEINGGFTSEMRFFTSNQPFTLKPVNELTLQSNLSEGFTRVDEHEFFKK